HTTLNIILNILYGTKTNFQDPLYLKLISLTHDWLNFGTSKSLIYDWILSLQTFFIGKMSIVPSETTASTITWIIAAIANDPEVQLRAQRELDSIVGQSILPSPKDMTSLPYIRALVKEDTIGKDIPLEKNDEYMRYYIPKNTVVFLNMFSIHSDLMRYPNPHIFNPDRYLGVTESAATYAQGSSEKWDQFTFEYVYHISMNLIVEMELENLVASILTAFKIEIPRSNDDENSPKLID
ncbi:4704_t:CDS:2, partial [Ambispora leptoticha]